MNSLGARIFLAYFTRWVESLRTPEPDIVAIAGEASRRAHPGNHPLHLISAWTTQQSQSLVIGQEVTATKSNEITAIPLLLERLN